MRTVDGDLSDRAKHWRPKDAEAHLRKRAKESKEQRRARRLAERKSEIIRRMAERCECGKVLTFDEDDARWLHAETVMHHKNTQAVRFYTCKYGRTHWTRQVEPRDG